MKETAPRIILCVDDDTTVLNALDTLLGKTLGGNIVVETAEGGPEALDIFNDHQKGGREVSVVISDFIMPGMRGDELLVRIHEKSPRTVKIMLTGQSDLQGVKRTINEANLYRFLEKPFNNADLLLTARAALNAYGLAEAASQAKEFKNRIGELEQLLANCSSELLVKNSQLEALLAKSGLAVE